LKQSILSLKLAAAGDADKVLPILRKLFDKSIYSTVTDFNVEDVRATFIQCVSEGVVILLCLDVKIVGLIAASTVSHLFDRKHKTAVELAFWLDDDIDNRKVALRRLIGAYRYWAKKVGCHSILMGKLKNKSEVETYTIRKL
jgi:hypothetical protein